MNTTLSILNGYVYGVKIASKCWYVRIGAWTGEGATVGDAMRDALCKVPR